MEFYMKTEDSLSYTIKYIKYIYKTNKTYNNLLRTILFI